MKKILRISLLISSFCLLLLCLNNSKVQATTVTVTTVKELQEAMGATEYSTIDGTTLKITNNFTWTISNDIDMNITEMTIDFNGKEIRIENNKQTNLGINLLKGKVIFKDLQGETGGVYSKGNFIQLGQGTELIIENGQYTAAHVQEANNGLITNIDNGLIRNNGGNITVKNGKFKTLSHAILFVIRGGKTVIDNGYFTGQGEIVEATGGYSREQTDIIINDGEFDLKFTDVLNLNAGGTPIRVVLNGGNVKTSNASCIMMNGHSDTYDYGVTLTLVVDGCELETTADPISLNGQVDGNVDCLRVELKNGTLRSTGGETSGAIGTIRLKSADERVIRKVVGRDDIETHTWKFSNDSYWEITNHLLIFEDGKLILEKENNTEDSTGNNTENNTENTVDNNAENVTKLPQTGEETNAFAKWLTIAISLMIFWLVSMLLIDREKKKMTKK